MEVWKEDERAAEGAWEDEIVDEVEEIREERREEDDELDRMERADEEQMGQVRGHECVAE